MPLVKITIRSGRSENHRKALLEGVHNALVQAFKIPEHDRYQILHEKEWIDERKSSLAITGNQFDDIIQKYKDVEENKPDTLDYQLNALSAAGFKDVDCYYKYGIFAMFGGRR